MAVQRPEARTSGLARGRRRAEELVDREYLSSRDTVIRNVRSKLRATGVALDDADIEAAYNQAWHALYAMVERGELVDNRLGLLTTVTYRRAIDDYRAMHVGRHSDLVDSIPALEPDVDTLLDDRRRLRSLREGMRLRLTPRELQAAVLCYIHGYTRPEAAEALGLTPRRMEKVMDRVSKRVADIVRDVEGGWCESQDSLIRAYALGLLDPDGDRYPLAAEHLEHCAACRRRVIGLRGLSSVVPPIPLVLAGGAATGGLAIGNRQDGASTSAAGTAAVAATGAVAAGSAAAGPRRAATGVDAAAAGATGIGATGAGAAATGATAAGTTAAAATGVGRLLIRAFGSGRRTAAVAGIGAIVVAAAVALVVTTGEDSTPARPPSAVAPAAPAPTTATPTGTPSDGTRSAGPDAETRRATQRSSSSAARRAARRARRASRGAGAAEARTPARAATATATTAAPTTPVAPAATTASPSTPAAPTGPTESATQTTPAPDPPVVDDGAEEFDLR